MTSVAQRGPNNPGLDYNHAEDPTYKQYRDEAKKWHDKRTEYSQQSQNAYQNGDKQAAHELSEKLKDALRKAEDANKRAAQYVFVENNADSKGNEIDLHGLYVNEAKWVLQKRIGEALRTSQQELLVIVGKGNHSQNGVAKLKPAIDELCSEAGLNHYISQKNSGVLVIDLAKTPNIRLPDSWDTLPFDHQPSSSGQGQQQFQQQPQYQQQQQPQYQQQSGQGNAAPNTGIPILDSVLKLVCACLK